MTEATYYFIGIKGSGMSALALVLHDLGHQVLGSDYPIYVYPERLGGCRNHDASV